MKYFTKEWASGKLDDVRHERARSDYWKRLNEISDEMPAPLKKLSNSISLHDALINRVSIDRTQSLLIVNLVAGDVQEGYFNLTLTYHDVQWEQLDLKKLSSAARDRRTELLYDEIDVLKSGRFSHNILMSGDYEGDKYFDLEFLFSEVDVSRSRRDGRNVDGGGDPVYFVEGEDSK